MLAGNVNAPSLGCGDGGRVVVGGDDHVVEVGLGEKGGEEFVGVGQAICGNDGWVSHKAVPPAHGVRQLTTSLNKEEGGGRNLRSSTPDASIITP